MEIALQLWSLENSGIDTLDKKFEAICEMGYDGVELLKHSESPDEIKALLKKHNLTAKSAHIPLKSFIDDLKGTLEYNKALGLEYLIIPWQSYDNDPEKQLWETIDILNKSSIEAKKYGIKIGYHNHAQEFEKIGGKCILDLLYENTNEDVVFQLDVFWVYIGGQDPLEYIKKFGKRAELIHLKQANEKKENVALPDGILDMKKIIETAKYSKSIVVEQEHKISNVIDACKKGAKYIKEM